MAIIGVLCSTLTDFADIHAGILPIELALLKATHRALTRMLILPPTHPLHNIVTYTRNNLPRKHVSPLANLLRIFKMNGMKMEKDMVNFKVFSDGLGLEAGVGVAAVLYTKERINPIGHLKAFLGLPTKRNTYEAEAVGAILAT